MRTDFLVGDDVVIFHGVCCGFQGVVTRVLACYLWVQGADDHVVRVRKYNVCLVVEGDSDEEETGIAPVPMLPMVPMPNIILDDDDSNATE
jgi:hypothetical protein